MTFDMLRLLNFAGSNPVIMIARQSENIRGNNGYINWYNNDSSGPTSVKRQGQYVQEKRIQSSNYTQDRVSQPKNLASPRVSSRGRQNVSQTP